MADFETAREVMVDRQVRPSDVTTYALIQAMLWAPRERFAPRSKQAIVYSDSPVEIAEGRWMLDPRNFAKLLDAAHVQPGETVLDIGCGLGYSTAVLSRLAGSVVAVEQDPAMAAQAEKNLAAVEGDSAVVIEGALAEGAPGEGPYDAIIMAGGAETVPEGLIAQLRDEGRLVYIHMDGAYGQARLVTRTGDTHTERRLFDAAAPVLPGFEKTTEFAF